MVVGTAFIPIGHKSAEAGRPFSSVLHAYVLPRLLIRMVASQHIWMRSDGRARREHDVFGAWAISEGCGSASWRMSGKGGVEVTHHCIRKAQTLGYAPPPYRLWLYTSAAKRTARNLELANLNNML